MKCGLVAQCKFQSIYDISPQWLVGQGISLLLADLDNTLVPYGIPEATEDVKRWEKSLKEAGITLFILSNNRHPARAKIFAQSLGIPYIGHGGKPKTASFYRAMKEQGKTNDQTAIVGDQLFTDMLGGNRSGIATYLVEPIALRGNPGRYLRYAVEWPFRMMTKK